jgi:hypothetical protein
VADYTPIALPGQTYTFNAGTAISGGDLVEITGVWTVGKISSNGSMGYVGVAGHDASIGSKVTVTLGAPIHESVADGTITAGTQLTTTSTSNRQVKAYAATAYSSSLTLPATYDNTTVPAAIVTAINSAVNTTVNASRAVVGVAVNTAADSALVRWVQV